MEDIGKLMIMFGAILLILGLLIYFGGKYLHLGRLPGDIAIEKGNFKFYFPIATSIIASIILTLIFLIISYFYKG